MNVEMSDVVDSKFETIVKRLDEETKELKKSYEDLTEDLKI